MKTLILPDSASSVLVGEKQNQRACRRFPSSDDVDSHAHLDFFHIFSAVYTGTAAEIQRRLPNLPAPEGKARIALTGHLQGLDPLLELANYLEVTAKKLRH